MVQDVRYGMWKRLIWQSENTFLYLYSKPQDMPTNQYYRNWCKTCNNFTIHSYPVLGSTDLTCKCGTVWTTVTVGEIPKEKILEQRKRYKADRSERFRKTYSYLTLMGMLGGGIDSTTIGMNVQETDAGLVEAEAIDKARREARDKAVREELDRFSKLGRNEPCLCGSELKYKKCCYAKHQVTRWVK